jgi:hypothetical protein
VGFWDVVLGKVLDLAVEELKEKLKKDKASKEKTFIMEPMGEAVVIFRPTCTEVVAFATLFSRVEDTIMDARLIAEWPKVSAPEVAQAEVSAEAFTLQGLPAGKSEGFVCPIPLGKGQGKLGFFYFRLAPRNADLEPKLSLRLTTGQGQEECPRIGAFPFVPSP